jgi:hypothetical protein
VGTIRDGLKSKTKDERDQHAIIKRLAEVTGSTDELANTVLALMVGTTVELSLGMYY